MFFCIKLIFCKQKRWLFIYANAIIRSVNRNMEES